MGAFLKIGDIKGDAEDQEHKDWILVETLSSPIHRTVPNDNKGIGRVRGETVLGDLVLVRNSDKATPKLAASCARGDFFPEAEIHFCSQIRGKDDPYLKYKLTNVLISSHSVSANENGDPMPSEQLTLSFTNIEWTWVEFDRHNGDKLGNHVDSFALTVNK
ncbi:MAG: Hcp family type VI secretion system effector [Planctomycetota bacterium]